MKPGDKYLFINVLKLSDLGVMTTAFALGAVATYADSDPVSFSEFLTMRISVTNFLLFLGFSLLWNRVYSIFGLYAMDRLTRAGPTYLMSVLKATTCGAIGIWLTTIFVKIEVMTETWLVVFWASACLMSMLWRTVMKVFLRGRWRSNNNLSHLVVVGTNARAVTLAKKITSCPELGYHLVGFVDDKWSGEAQFRQNGYSLVCDFNGFQEYLKDHVVDEVIICVPLKSLYDWSHRILTQCEQQGITVRFLSDLFTPTIGHPSIEPFEEHTVFTVNTGGMLGPAMRIKRLFDFCASVILLILLFPLMLGTAIAVRAGSPGPIFFIQERVGLNKRRFRLYKFRTMVADAEKRLADLEHCNEVSGPVFKIKRDPRITRVGAFLRKTSLDELPQLINVVKGDMSLVGPRPLPVRDYRGFTENWHRRRFSVRPGITCLWQVCGRSAIPFDRWMELDMQYIDEWSLMLDLKILLKTIPSVLKGSGAS